MLIRIIRKLIAAVVFLGFILYLWEHREELLMVFDASLFHVALIVPAIILSWYVSGLQSYYIYRAVNIPIGKMEGIMITVAGSFANHLPMRAGTLVNAYYLKELYGLKYASFSGILAVRFILTISAAGLLGLIGVLIVYMSGSYFSVYLFVIFAAMVLGSVMILYFLSPEKNGLLRKITPRLKDVSDSLYRLRSNLNTLLYLILLLLVQYTLLSVRFMISADAINSSVKPEILLLTAPLAALMSFIAITPGGLGLREAVMGYVTMELGKGFSDGFFIGTVDRAILLIMTGAFGGAAFLTIWKQCKPALKELNS